MAESGPLRTVRLAELGRPRSAGGAVSGGEGTLAVGGMGESGGTMLAGVFILPPCIVIDGFESIAALERLGECWKLGLGAKSGRAIVPSVESRAGESGGSFPIRRRMSVASSPPLGMSVNALRAVHVHPTGSLFFSPPQQQ